MLRSESLKKWQHVMLAWLSVVLIIGVEVLWSQAGCVTTGWRRVISGWTRFYEIAVPSLAVFGLLECALCLHRDSLWQKLACLLPFLACASLLIEYVYFRASR